MITQNGFNCVVLNAKEKTNASLGKYFYCTIGIPVKYKGFWQKKDGTKYYEKWRTTNIYTEFEIEEGDNLAVSEFEISQLAHNKFGQYETYYIINIYGFTNETKDYSVGKPKRTRKKAAAEVKDER